MLNASPLGSPEYQRLVLARNALAGLGDNGQTRIHSSMFDSDVISFAHGEGMCRPHPSVVAAGVRALIDTSTSSIENYLFLQHVPELDFLIEKRFEGIGIPPESARNIVLDAGTTRIFFAFINLFCKSGDILITPPGFYHPLAAWCDYCGVRLLCVPTKRQNDYKLTAEDLEAWWSINVVKGRIPPPTTLLLFNPSMAGAVYSHVELVQLAQSIDRHGLFTIEDAIFAETEFPDRKIAGRLGGISGMENRVLTVSGGSKAHGLANIRIGWACGPAHIVERLNAYVVATSATIPQVAKFMACAALKVSDEYLENNRREAKNRAELVIRLVSEMNEELKRVGDTEEDVMNVEFSPSAGHSILLSFDGLRNLQGPLGDYLKDSIQVTRFFLNYAKVAFSPGISMGWDGCKVRCVFGCVGTPFTFDDLRAEEARLILDQMRFFYDTPSRESDLILKTNFPPNPAEETSKCVSSFEAGRALIQTGLSERSLPALRKILTH